MLLYIEALRSVIALKSELCVRLLQKRAQKYIPESLKVIQMNASVTCLSDDRSLWRRYSSDHNKVVTCENCAKPQNKCIATFACFSQQHNLSYCLFACYISCLLYVYILHRRLPRFPFFSSILLSSQTS